MDSLASMKHVVIVGGGFAGVSCAHDLARSDKVCVTLVDRLNYHQFKPLFYQLAVSALTPGDVSFSLRKIFRKSPNVDIKLAEVNDINPKSCSVSTKEGQTYQGDFLALAAGAQANFFNTPGGGGKQLSVVFPERCGASALANPRIV